MQFPNLVQSQEAISLVMGHGLQLDLSAVHRSASDEEGGVAPLLDDAENQPDIPRSAARARWEPEDFIAEPDPATNADAEDGDAMQGEHLSSREVEATGTRLGVLSVTERPRDNPGAADLLDHWGHRRVQNLVESLALDATPLGIDATDLDALRTSTQGREAEFPVPTLQKNDRVDILGFRHGIAYGRWTGGPADTLSIRFDLSRAGQEMRDNPAFGAMLERAGKSWSYRISDTWAAWERAPGERKGYLLPHHEEVRVGENGEASTGVEIHVTYGALSGAAGRALTSSSRSPPDRPWEPRFGSIEIDTAHLQEASKAILFDTIAHEIGHVLGAWMGGPTADPYVTYANKELGTWSGPHVVAVHGGPAPFRTYLAAGAGGPTAVDFGHSGVCTSIMSYCQFTVPTPAFLPQEIDFAFLADLGMTIKDYDERPETYGLAGWTDYASFMVSVSRDLRVGLANPQPHHIGFSNIWQTPLDVTDELEARVDVFGYLSSGDVLHSYPTVGVEGTVRYAGGLVGAAVDRAWLPPVTGDANLAVDLGTQDGTASFTSLEVHTDGVSTTFADGSLHYPFELSAGSIMGTKEGPTLRADFYGPGHEDIAGALRDPEAGLLASFGATHDGRPGREDVIAAADHMAGIAHQRGAAEPASDGWHRYRCGTGSACESRDPGSSGWKNSTREQVLSSTAGWNVEGTEVLAADLDFVRIAHRSAASTDGRQGRRQVDSYTGTLEHATFGTGFEEYANWALDRGGKSPGLHNSFTLWSGFQGTLSGSAPLGLARWSGPMQGYQAGQAASANPFVEGLATVKFSLSENRVDVAFSDVASRDGLREVPEFGFENLPAQADGRFSASAASGIVDGAFFGPLHEEAAGSFHHNATQVTGSFGAGRMTDAVTLEDRGDTAAFGDIAGGSGFYAFHEWGLWGTQFGDDLFGAFVGQTIEENGGTRTFYSPYGRVEGTPSGHNPVSGSAIWSGKVRAFDTRSDAGPNWIPVSGNARLEVDFDDAKVNVDFTDFEAGHGNMAWNALPIRDGAFRDTDLRLTSDGYRPTIEGAFYGTEHQGAAGTFRKDDLEGVFGAVRN